jgi:hypothetical protein
VTCVCPISCALAVPDATETMTATTAAAQVALGQRMPTLRGSARIGLGGAD